MRCPKCNYPVLPKFDKCPKCGEPLLNNSTSTSATDAHMDPISSTFESKNNPSAPKAANFDFDQPTNVSSKNEGRELSVLNGKVIWSLGPGEIARKITPEEMADCKSARGVVVQDGVTAAIFVDGSLAKVMEGGIYRFGNETVMVDEKPQVVTRHNEVVRPPREVIAPQNNVQNRNQKGEKDTGIKKFFSNLFGAHKEKISTPPPASISPAEKAKLEEKKRREEEKRRQVAEQARKALREKNEAAQPVVTVYLMSNRIFEISFGKEDSNGSYQPITIQGGIHDIEVGVRMQLCITDFEIFRQNYLVDSTQVTISSLRSLMTPWVKDILNHALNKTNLSSGLTIDESKRVVDLLTDMLQSRLFGIEIVNIFDLLTSSEDFEALRKKENELWKMEKDIESQRRLNEFRNRVAALDAESDFFQNKLQKDFDIKDKETEVEYQKRLRGLNQDDILSQDEFDKFLELHEVEVSLRKAALNADEQTRRYEIEKILAQIESRKLVDADEFEAIKDSVENKRFEREQLNDILRSQALAKSTLEKLKIENETALEKSRLDHTLDLQNKQFQIEDLDLEQQLYGKQYALEKQKAADALEQESLALDAQIIRMRKEDEYADERRRKERIHEHDEWEEQFLRESKTFDRSIEQQKKQADFDFDQKVRNTEFDFDQKVRNTEFDFDQKKKESEFDFDLKTRQATFDFDLDQKRADADTERSIRLDAHAQDMADRAHQREMEDKRLEQEALRLKGNIAMENMKAMMEAKRAQRQDELQADIDKLNIRSQMSAEQIASEQLSGLDAQAQKAYMDAMREKHSSTHENEALKREMEARREMQEQSRNDMKEMMAQMMAMTQQSNQQFADLAKTSMNANADIAKARAEAETGAAQRRAEELERDNARYREDAQFAQNRLDQTQRDSLKYSTQQTVASQQGETKPIEETPETVRLNTAWLREHNFRGSFNELAGMLNSMGAEISQDFDNQGNPVIVVDGLLTGQVMKVLQDCGVEF